MIAEIGHFALILALCLSIVQALGPLVGGIWRQPAWALLTIPAARWQFGCLCIAFACLTLAFITQDFSVAYVAQNSNPDLPMHYRISAVWGAHEGSLLLWVVLLAGWTVAVSIFNRSLPITVTTRVLAVLGAVSIGFLSFTVFTSNPFLRQFPAVARGDLNPLLQDPGLIIHPPMLYMGYVGLAVPFAFAIAALIEGRVDILWTRWTRPWTSLAWVFLTLGIALGSWWAYYELGWGGWWFWDPVENASFMPWLVATALLHSLAVTEQRSIFKAWTLLLAISGFALSLLGTFLVRSGVLVSVHAFATDPTRGVFILIFLSLVIGGAWLLYAWRAGTVISSGHFKPLSRETLLLINNVLLVVAAASILLGTLYPLLLDALNAGKISVGPPYFNRVFVPLMLPLAFLIGIGPLTRWQQDQPMSLLRKLYKTALFTALLSIALILFAFGPVSAMLTLSLTLACWILLTTIKNILTRLQINNLSDSLKKLTRGFIGMNVAHLGIAVFMVGVTVVSTYEQTSDVRLAPGERYVMAGYQFELLAVETITGPNYRAERASIRVAKSAQPQRLVAMLYPEKRYYFSQASPMTEAGIDAGLFRDVYVSLAEPLSDGAWAVHLAYKPFVRWIWLGALLMACGGLIAATDRRYFAKPKSLASAGT